MKKRIQHTPGAAGEPAVSYRAATGDHCPAHGWWAPTHGTGHRYFIAEGSIMPAVDGAPGTWELILSRPQRAYLHHQDFTRGLLSDSI